MSQTSEKLYLKIDAQTSVRVFADAAEEAEVLRRTDPERAAAAAAAAEAGTAVPEDAAALDAHARVTTLAELASRRGRPGGVYRLLLTACRVFELTIAIRCGECHEVRVGGSCQCGGGGGGGACGARRSGQLEATASVEVSDGSDRAYLDVSGPLVWTLLQCPPTAVRALSAAAAAVGPLRCGAVRSKGEDIVKSRGFWNYGAASTDAARTATARALPTGATWQREFVAYCRCINSVQPRGPAGWTLDRETAWVGGERQPTAAPAVRTKLQAVRLAPVSARQELERLLG